MTEIPAEQLEQTQALFLITFVHWIGWRDDLNPNNEAVRIDVGPEAGGPSAIVLDRYVLTNGAGQSFTFQDGVEISADRPVWVYSGAGISMGGNFFWNQTSGAWDEMDLCAVWALKYGAEVHKLPFGEGNCAKP